MIFLVSIATLIFVVGMIGILNLILVDSRRKPFVQPEMKKQSIVRSYSRSTPRFPNRLPPKFGHGTGISVEPDQPKPTLQDGNAKPLPVPTSDIQGLRRVQGLLELLHQKFRNNSAVQDGTAVLDYLNNQVAPLKKQVYEAQEPLTWRQKRMLKEWTFKIETYLKSSNSVDIY